MRVQRKGAAKTAKSLLAAASDVFAEKGYRDATIAEICKRAKANIAAVNYHFGDKETLYTEAWRHSFSESVKAHPPDGGVNDGAPPEERLRGQVVALLRRIADEDNREFLIVQKELANPTGLLNKVMRVELRPLQEKMEILIRDLLGPHVSDMQVRFCEISIISQCINPMVVRSRYKERREDKYSPPGVDDIEAYSKHVVEFSLAGIRAVRDDAEKKRRGFKK
ncbi:MAG: CerR family C-terminal domain-containing protein [Syntrophaceae bacterium]|nr:CerR family C-terminal domain-containing protein [Syntrophaceae bacterium]